MKTDFPEIKITSEIISDLNGIILKWKPHGIFHPADIYQKTKKVHKVKNIAT